MADRFFSFRNIFTGIFSCRTFAYALFIAIQFAANIRAEHYDNQRSLLEEVIVTGVRERSLDLLPQNVSVITREDIELAPSANLIELLSREANVTLRSFTGNDKRGGVDIRGMGDTFGSNVLVLVDGKKLNAIDQSGADLSSISLWQIERIEVVRGANSVRYSDGAVAGVINIITRKAEQDSTIDVIASDGAFDTRQKAVRAAYQKSDISLALTASDFDSEGYRENGDLAKEDIGFDFDYEINSSLKLFGDATHHHDEYGLPGPVSEEDFKGSSRQRRSSSAPFDHGETDDDRGRLGVQWQSEHYGNLEFSTNARNRENPYILGFNPLLDENDQESLIKEKNRSYELLYSRDLQKNNNQYFIDSGYTQNHSDYSRYANGRYIPGNSEEKNGELENSGWFLAGSWKPFESFTINTGYRSDRSHLDQQELAYEEFCEYMYVYYLNTPASIPYNCGNAFSVKTDRDELWKNYAHDLGTVWNYSDNGSFYTSIAKSYRNPNVDDLILSDNDLGPQTGTNIEAGVRQKITSRLSATISFYQMNLKDEILYGQDQLSGITVNRNSDEKTQRDGIETELRWEISEKLRSWISTSFSRSEFRETGTEVSLVPNKTINLGFEWEFFPKLTASVIGKYVGKRYDGNDFSNNQYQELVSYQVWDFKLLYRQSSWQIHAGLNNAFDEIYAASAYSGTFYPMPERNAYAGIRLSF